MPKQNIFDNETFFEGYRKIREKASNANDLFEIPTLFSLLPETVSTAWGPSGTTGWVMRL